MTIRCAECGHTHTGKQWAYICIGCPCPAQPTAEQREAWEADTGSEQ
jgi:hypothetical protein